MPELPEVETIARQLRELVVGRRIAEFSSLWHRVTEPLPAKHFAERLVGREITGVGRRGKFVVLELDGGEALIVSLRMTGKLLFREALSAEDAYVRAVVGFADGTFLRFADTRKFGRMAIVDVRELADESRPRAPHAAHAPLHRSLGIEPLSPRFTRRWFAVWPGRLSFAVCRRPTDRRTRTSAYRLATPSRRRRIELSRSSTTL